MSITKTASKTVYPTKLIKWALLAKLFSSSFKRVKHKGKSTHKKLSNHRHHHHLRSLLLLLLKTSITETSYD